MRVGCAGLADLHLPAPVPSPLRGSEGASRSPFRLTISTMSLTQPQLQETAFHYTSPPRFMPLSALRSSWSRGPCLPLCPAPHCYGFSPGFAADPKPLNPELAYLGAAKTSRSPTWSEGLPPLPPNPRAWPTLCWRLSLQWDQPRGPWLLAPRQLALAQPSTGPCLLLSPS